MKFMIVDESYKASTELSHEEPTQITTITSSKNSCAAFQLLLHDGKKNHFILNKQFSIPDEIEIPMYRIAIKSDLPYQAQFVDYYLGTDGLAYADKLIGETAYTYSGDRYAPIYIEIPIDKQVKPGTYPVQLSVYRSFINQEDELVAEKSIEVSVLDFAFPDDVQQDFRLDIWQQPSNLARTFHVPLWGDAHFGLVDQMADKLAAIGQKAVTVIAGEIPWKGWFNYIVKDYPANLYEYSMIPIRKNIEGALICDFSILDRYLACFEKYGINQEINLFGLLGVWKPPYFPLNEQSGHSEKIVLRYFDESTDKITFIEQAADFTAYLKQLVFHLKEIGVWERTYVTADEPKSHEVEAFIQAVNDLKAIEPSIQIKVAFDKESVLNSLESVIDYPVTSFYCTCNNQQQLLEKFGKKLNYYICNYPTKPNTFLHSPLLETRVQGLLAYYFKTDGLLRWALNCWPTNARTDIRYNTGALPIGDNCLIYPGYNGDLLLSLRYKQLLRGIEDFWLLKHAEEQNEKKVQQLLDEFLVVTDPKDWMLNSHQANPEAFQLTEEKYQQLRNALIRINQGE
ncbi:MULTISPECIES: DUF4091 domain-containing protein [Enterococcus]|uniref:DUF4091 domain-containing protein n=1 Tax=Enterococcus TaxID=1350 RepID=UPI0011070ABB|nr:MULTISPECIES: DUF4091 domain-containing protein [Enterococcus]MDB1679851.1 DUF4091 domain-containing protein [Enterococcus durans]